MVKINAFERHAAEYEGWFDDYHYVYESELEALKLLLPEGGSGLEIGMGTGRFALPLGIEFGVEPAKAMADRARAKKLQVVRGVGEALPFANAGFDKVLFVTSVCFLDSVDRAFQEAFRVVRTGGALLVGFIDKDSFLARKYEKRKKESLYYREANFHSVKEILGYLEKAGFRDFKVVETIFRPLDEITAREPIKEGYGEGAFVVARAIK
ncbi:MAG: class I SAM-dependent methyltransferase [Desulfurivibrionaceae bacterium]